MSFRSILNRWKGQIAGLWNAPAGATIRTRRGARPSVEALEDRLLMAGNVVVTQDGDDLTIGGDLEANGIEITGRGGVIEIRGLNRGSPAETSINNNVVGNNTVRYSGVRNVTIGSLSRQERTDELILQNVEILGDLRFVHGNIDGTASPLDITMIDANVRGGVSVVHETGLLLAPMNLDIDIHHSTFGERFRIGASEVINFSAEDQSVFHGGFSMEADEMRNYHVRLLDSYILGNINIGDDPALFDPGDGSTNNVVEFLNTFVLGGFYWQASRDQPDILQPGIRTNTLRMFDSYFQGEVSLQTGWTDDSVFIYNSEFGDRGSVASDRTGSIEMDFRNGDDRVVIVNSQLGRIVGENEGEEVDIDLGDNFGRLQGDVVAIRNSIFYGEVTLNGGDPDDPEIDRYLDMGGVTFRHGYDPQSIEYVSDPMGSLLGGPSIEQQVSDLRAMAGAVVVRGSNGDVDESIRVLTAGDELVVQIDTGTATSERRYYLPDLTAIRIEPSGGDDRVDIESLGVALPVMIDTGEGADVVRLAPRGRDLDALNGSTISLVDDSGIDTLWIHDNASSALDPFTITDTAMDLRGITLTHEGFDEISLYTGQLKNSIHVEGLAKGPRLNAHGGAGGTTFVVGNATNGLGSLQGSLHLYGLGNGDTIVIDDRASDQGRSFTLLPEDVVATGTTGFSHQGITTHVLIAGEFADEVDVSESPNNLPVLVRGGGGEDTLIGPDTFGTHTWEITDANAGTLDAVIAFSQVENLTGGISNDIFAFSPGGSLAGSIDGGGFIGGNSLNYTEFDMGVIVNLTNRTTSGLGGHIHNIQHVTGGAGNDILVGNAEYNFLNGMGGRDLLIGGANPAGVQGDLLSGERFLIPVADGEGDILVGGSTQYDDDPETSALERVMTEWSRDEDYDIRVRAVLEGGLLGVGDFTSNGRGNFMQGGVGEDLFYGSLARDNHDRDLSLDEVFVDPNAIQQGVTINATLLGHASQPALRNIWIDAVRYDGATPISLDLAPGEHQLWGAQGAGATTFRVEYDGTIRYDAALEGALTGAGTNTLNVIGRTVTLDASALGLPGIWIDGVAVSGAQQDLPVNLLPGAHSLFSHGTSGNSYTFTVADSGDIISTTAPAGVIDIDTADAARLIISGRPVTFDVSARPDIMGLWINGRAYSFTGSRAQTLNFLPGTHRFFTATGDTYRFTVSDAGVITSIDAPAGILNGVGTATLSMAAPSLRVTVSATRLGHASQPALRNFWIDGVHYNGSSVQSILLTPGRHQLRTAGTNFHYFTVNANGTIDYDASLHGPLGGRGSNQLYIVGRPVRLNASALGLSNLYIDGASVNDARQELIVYLMPGSHSLFSHNTNGNVYNFTVDSTGRMTTTAPAGVIDLDPFNANRLILRGLRVEFDVSARPDVQTMWINGVAYSFQQTRELTLNLLPGRHVLRTADNVSHYFRVFDDGSVAFESAPAGIVLRRGS